MTMDINHKLEKYGANILVVPRTDHLTLTYGGLSLGGVSFEMQEIRQAQLKGIGNIKNAANIAALGPVVLGSVRVNDKPVLLAGVDFKTAYILKPWWKVDGAYPAGPNDLVVGHEAARQLGLQKGMDVDLNGTPLKITGILEATGSQDDQLLFSRVATAQQVLNKPGVISMIEVAALCKDCPIDAMVSQISGVLPDAKVMAIQQVVKGRMETLAQFRNFAFGISMVIVLIGGLVVLVTLMSSVRERTEEIGIFRAIGFRRQHVMRIVFLEAGVISALAGIIGYGLGLAGARMGIVLLTDHAAMGVPLSLDLAAASFGLAIAVGMLASAYPAWLASRMDPNEALRAL
jgi:putative ABC transport system permease protein